jgi:serine/threonine-protein kinase
VSDSILGRYRVLESLGAGGMGDVFLAQREGSPEVCVLKRLRAELLDHESAMPRFSREAQIAALLDHPGIARTIDAGLDGDSFYIAMELIAGIDLFAISMRFHQRKELMPLEFAATIVIRALEALAYAHDARDADGTPLEIVHRDLAPKNLMVTFDGRVKVIDFGVARANVGGFKTASGALIGTLRYLSPEQACAHAIDRKSDLYTLSVVFHEMLSGRPLVRQGELVDMLQAVIAREAPPIRELRPDVPVKLAHVLARGLAKDPSARWPDATAYLEAIRGAARSSELSEEQLAACVREWFPEQAQRVRQRIEEGRRRFEASGEREPEQFTVTRAEAISSGRSRGGASPSVRATGSEAEERAAEAIALAPSSRAEARPHPRMRARVHWAAMVPLLVALIAVTTAAFVDRPAARPATPPDPAPRAVGVEPPASPRAIPLPAAGERSAEELAAEERATKESAAKESATVESAAEERATKESAALESAAVERATKESAALESAAVEEAPFDRSTAVRSLERARRARALERARRPRARAERSKRPNPPPPALDLSQALASRSLTRADLAHQHDLAAELAQLRTQQQLDALLARVSFAPDRLMARLERVQDRLQQADRSTREFREAERRYLDIRPRITDEPSPAEYRELCAMIDALERDLP